MGLKMKATIRIRRGEPNTLPALFKPRTISIGPANPISSAKSLLHQHDQTAIKLPCKTPTVIVAGGDGLTRKLAGAGGIHSAL